MATIYEDFIGIASWAKLQEPDEYMDNRRWCITIGFDEKSRELFDNIDPLLRIKSVEGGEGVQFRRDCEKVISGDLVKFDPPRVQAWNKEEERYDDFDEVIGNGSRVKVNVQFYDSKKGKGHRLCSVTVLEHTPYTPATQAPETTEPNETDGEEITPW